MLGRCLPTEREPRTAIFLFLIVLAAISEGKERKIKEEKENTEKVGSDSVCPKNAACGDGGETPSRGRVYRADCAGDTTADAGGVHEK